MSKFESESDKCPKLQPYVDSEIVIGLVGTVGADLEGFAHKIECEIKNYKYNDVKIINVSNEIIDSFKDIFTIEEKGSDDISKKINAQMDLGNLLRKEDSGLIGLGIINIIQECRHKISETPEPIRRKAFIVKSLKNTKEVEILRSVYGNGFYLIGIYEEENKRLDYLVSNRSMLRNDAEDLIRRDSSEEEEYGQQSRDTYQLSDFFINMSSVDLANHTLKRILDLIFGNPFLSPTFEEYCMFMAFASSLRSADLSRQVGAVVSKDHEIISTGANDCPKFGGGLYWTDCKENEYIDESDGKDYTRGYDSNKVEFNKIVMDIFDRFGIEDTDENRLKMKKSKLSNLTEYGRSVHAEMEALSACARNGVSSKDATMYVTTFPCHNCAKHIVAAGVKKVVYIEPYPKSKALELYSDSIDNKNNSAKVSFIPFSGVGPRKYMELFAMDHPPLPSKERKDKLGNKTIWKPADANIRSQMRPTSYLDVELEYARRYVGLKEKIESIGGNNNGG